MTYQACQSRWWAADGNGIPAAGAEVDTIAFYYPL